MKSTRYSATRSFLGIFVLLPLTQTGLCLGGETAQKAGINTTLLTLRQAIENRLGRPNRVIGDEDSLLLYHLENGDTLTFVLAGNSVLGIEHTKRLDLKGLVGKKITIVGVYNGLAKGDDQILTPDGNVVDIEGRHDMSRHGKLVSATAVLAFFPGTNGPVDVQGIPRHYYMKSNTTVLNERYPTTFEKIKPVERSQQIDGSGSF